MTINRRGWIRRVSGRVLQEKSGAAMRSGFAVGIVACSVLAASVIACSSQSSAFEPSQTPAAQNGRTAARAMLGLAAAPEAASATFQAEDADYEAIAADMLIVVEQQAPGIFDRFGADIDSRDGARAISAWTSMRDALAQASGSPALLAAAQSDPAFGGATISAFTTQDGLGISTYQPPQDGVPNLGRGPDGYFGDGKTGPGQAILDLEGLDIPQAAAQAILAGVDAGTVNPDPGSRLGAYQCTGGHAVGTVGHAVHNAIGFIFVELGTYGEEKIGRVFCDPAAQAILNDPVDSASSTRIAQIEQRYWQNVAGEDPYSPGGRLGAAFSPSARNFLQQHVFRGLGSAAPSATSTSTTPTSSASASSSSSPPTSPSTGSPGIADAGANDSGLSPSDCSDKTDGWWCIYESPTIGYMAYCSNHSIAGGCPCSACLGSGGTAASCSSAPPPAACSSN